LIRILVIGHRNTLLATQSADGVRARGADGPAYGRPWRDGQQEMLPAEVTVPKPVRMPHGQREDSDGFAGSRPATPSRW
jgi:hypothetical protein